MRIAIVNKKIGLNSSPTGTHAMYLANFLKQEGHDIYIISTSEPSSLGFHYEQVARSYDGKIVWQRFISSFLLSFRLVRRVKSIPLDVVVFLTDPSFMSFWSSVLALKCPMIVWTMDVYPDAFVAARILRKDNLLLKMYTNISRRAIPNAFISLGPKQSGYLLKDYPKVQVIPYPVGLIEPASSVLKDELPKWYEGDQLIYLAYVGNLGEAHDPLPIKILAQHLSPDMRLILKCSTASAEVWHDLRHYPNVIHVLGTISNEALSYVDIQMVILREEWTHISVPSKALSSVCLGNAILYVGSVESDSWQYVKDCGWHIADSAMIPKWLKTLNKAMIEEKRSHCLATQKMLLDKRQEALSKLVKTLTEIETNH